MAGQGVAAPELALSQVVAVISIGMRGKKRGILWVTGLILLSVLWLLREVSEGSDSDSLGWKDRSPAAQVDPSAKSGGSAITRSSRRLKDREPAAGFQVELSDGKTFAFVEEQEVEGRLLLVMITSEIIETFGGSRMIRLVSKILDFDQGRSGADFLPELSGHGDGMILAKNEVEVRMRQFSQTKGVNILTHPSAVLGDGGKISIPISNNQDGISCFDLRAALHSDGQVSLDISPPYFRPKN